MAIGQYLAAVEKAELYLHFQSSIRPGTLLELARRHGIPLPVADESGLRKWFEFRDFAHFVEVYALLRACLVEPDDFELVTAMNSASTSAGFSTSHAGR